MNIVCTDHLGTKSSYINLDISMANVRKNNNYNSLNTYYFKTLNIFRYTLNQVQAVELGYLIVLVMLQLLEIAENLKFVLI